MKKNIILNILLFSLLYSACSNAHESVIQRVLGINATAPVFINCKATSPTEVEFHFSTPVKVNSIYFEPEIAFEDISEGEVVTVNLKQQLLGGELITADILVEDSHRNTLNVLVPFRTRNDRMPTLIINEIRTEYSKPKVEFVEFRPQTSGNLGALRLFIASNGIDTPVFEFPPVEVRAGEYIVIHLRSIEEGLVNETGTNLGASKGTEAFSYARDFWIPDAKKLLRKTDAVFFMDQDDNVLSAIVLSENPDTWGTRQEIPKAVEMLVRKGAWSGTSLRDAFPSKGTTVTRSISRDEKLSNNKRASDWYITATSGASPGSPNNPKRYEAK